MATTPKGIRREGAHLLYGNILLATLHEDINLTVEPKELERFIKRIERQSKKAKETETKI